uniref:TIMELESS-interacting protein n=1 Tax=Castor canadensis TaxID=51338 RepID=A0A8C0X2U8_CASCN
FINILLLVGIRYVLGIFSYLILVFIGQVLCHLLCFSLKNCISSFSNSSNTTDLLTFLSTTDEVGENNNLDVTAAELDPFLTNASESEKFASESSRSLTEEQQKRIERNKQLALERRQAKLLNNSQSLENDTLMNTPRAQTEEVFTGEDQEEGVPVD